MKLPMKRRKKVPLPEDPQPMPGLDVADALRARMDAEAPEVLAALHAQARARGVDVLDVYVETLRSR